MTNKDALLINGTNVLFNDETNCVLNYRAKPNLNLEQDSCSILLTEEYTNFLTKINQNDTIEIWRGKDSYSERRIFKGRIKIVRPQGPLLMIEGVGDFDVLSKKEINQTYDENLDSQAGNLGLILKDIVEDGGLTSSIETTSGTIEKLEFKNDKRNRAALDVANILLYQLYYNHHTAVVIGEPKKFNSSGITLSSGVFPVLNILQFKDDSQKVINEFVIEGAEKLVGKTEWFNGTGSEDKFVLERTPRSINAVWSGTANFSTTRPTDADLKIGGQEGVTSGLDYTWFENTKTITFLTGDPVSGTKNVQIDYTYPESLPVIVRSNESINFYDEIFRHSVSVEGIKTVDDAENMGNSLIQEFAFQRTETEIEVLNDLEINTTMQSIHIGKAITVIDTISAETRNSEFVVREITFQYPEPFDIIKVGDRLFKMDDIVNSMDQRIRRLEERSGNFDFTNDISQIENTVDTRLITEVYESGLETDTMYWGDENQGTWGDFNWGDGSGESDVLKRRLHGVGNIYFEDFRDSDLTDLSNTTATVNTTTNKINFTNGQVWMSQVIFLDNKGFSNIRWSLADVETTGLTNLMFYASANGKTNWQELTLGTLENFSNTSIDGVYLKIVSSGVAELSFNNEFDKSVSWKIEVDVGV